MVTTKASSVSGIHFVGGMSRKRSWKLLICWFSIVAIVKSDIPVDDVKTEEMMHSRPHFADSRQRTGGDLKGSPAMAVSSTHYSAEGQDSDELKRTRRFNSLGKEEGMAFYRPTKHNSLFFISSSENSPKFQATEVQEKRFSSSHGGAVNPASMQIQNSSTIDRSDHLTVRSVSEEQQSWSTEDELPQDEVGGISNIPGLSSSEEKFLEYANYQSETSTASDLLDELDFTDVKTDKYESITAGIGVFNMDEDEEIDSDLELDDQGKKKAPRRHHPRMDIVSKLLSIVETQALMGENCNPGSDLNLGEKVVNRYAQERFHDAAMIAVNMANWFTRMWKYAPEVIGQSEYLIHATLFHGTELSDDIFAFGNCYDAREYKNYFLFCPYAYRLPKGPILAKDLAIEYKYLSNTSEWFFIARKRAESVIQGGRPQKIGYHTYTHNATAHTTRSTDKILTVKYEDGAWTKPYYDCGGGNIWMMTYTVPFFGFENGQYFFKGTSGIDIDLRRVDINQCPGQSGGTGTLIFGGTDKCKKDTTVCEPIAGLGFRRGSYKCVCKTGYYYPNTTAENRFFNGTDLEEEYSKILEGQESDYEDPSAFQCLKCAEGCESCEDGSPCIVTLNWVLRTILLILQCVIIGCLPVVVLFTYKYKEIKVVKAASPVLLRIIILGAFFIYSTTIILYPTPNIVTCTLRIWLREIGFALAYGALMLKTWRISIIFRVKSAKAVKITDIDLIKRLGLIVGAFVLCLLIRTLVSPPVVIIGRTSDHLKAFLCQSDWWDHSFTILEFLFLLWGIRLCIMVRKAPSEFNESRFISMTIYNEFLLSIFLNVSVFFLQQPANPDLLYIIFFCHSQLTISILLCLIFASKFYLVMKGHGKQDEGNNSMTSKSGPGKFVTSKVRVAHNSLSQASNMPATVGLPPNGGSGVGLSTFDSSKACLMSDKDIEVELDRIFQTLQVLKEKGSGAPADNNAGMALKIAAIQEALKTASASEATVGQPNPTSVAATSSSSPKGFTTTESSHQKNSVQILNGQVVNCQSAPLLPVNNQSPPKILEHDSPIIVHQIEAKTRVSFDLNKDEVDALANGHGQQQQHLLSTTSKPPETILHHEDEHHFHCNDSMSSCHSSKCCCSSYVCSVCSPRGSLENVEEAADSASNSIDITSPRLKCAKEPENSLKNHQDQRAGGGGGRGNYLEMSSKITQTEEENEEMLENNLNHLASDCSIREDAADKEALIKKAENSSNVLTTTTKAGKRILINLDDKNRFTDEITV